MIILTLPPCASVRPHARRPPAVCRPLARQQQFQMVHTTGRQAPNRYRCTAAAAGATAAAAAAAGADPPLVAPALALQPGQPVVKVCGVINAEDAAAAVAAGEGEGLAGGWGRRAVSLPSCRKWSVVRAALFCCTPCPPSFPLSDTFPHLQAPT